MICLEAIGTVVAAGAKHNGTLWYIITGAVGSKEFAAKAEAIKLIRLKAFNAFVAARAISGHTIRSICFATAAVPVVLSTLQSAVFCIGLKAAGSVEVLNAACANAQGLWAGEGGAEKGKNEFHELNVSASV